ncbi:hypothetical protein L228DRAFT_269456 [Xylona heveae TC161]|uniref:Uncharacterized protein n=1 Tax=Xylona heveae (strain CBS 132557 / TC161) TaxID=1328760 RepID=A0A165FJK2_XYLHT|nr:hypothetical protein L228DRAFT_269456 [Xylona heveae TC161]KZF21051.1 hypothetical protein L228DRAFT_269456 [Xylona heveae TC161]
MTGITHAISDLFSSIFGVFRSILNTLLSSIESVAAVFQTLLADVLNLFKTLIEFFFKNFIILSLIAAGIAGYIVYSQRQTRTGQRKPLYGAGKKST